MRFPADRFASAADYAAWHALHPLALDDRALAEAAAPAAGSCAICARPTAFVGGVCDCADRMGADDRALLHAAVAEAGLGGWSRLRLIGVEGTLAWRLSDLAGPAGQKADIVVADMAAGDPDGLLRRAAGSLVGGGCLLARMSFDPAVRHSPAAGRLGWNVLELTREAGFGRAEILRPWSRELGYLGGGLFLLKAVVPD